MNRSCCYCVYEYDIEINDKSCNQIIIDVFNNVENCPIHGESENSESFIFYSLPTESDDYVARREKFESDTKIKLPDEDFSVLLVDTWFKEASFDDLALCGHKKTSLTYVSECEERDEFYKSNEYKFLVAFMEAARNLAERNSVIHEI